MDEEKTALRDWATGFTWATLGEAHHIMLFRHGSEIRGRAIMRNGTEELTAQVTRTARELLDNRAFPSPKAFGIWDGQALLRDIRLELGE